MNTAFCLLSTLICIIPDWVNLIRTLMRPCNQQRRDSTVGKAVLFTYQPRKITVAFGFRALLDWYDAKKWSMSARRALVTTGIGTASNQVPRQNSDSRWTPSEGSFTFTCQGCKLSLTMEGQELDRG